MANRMFVDVQWTEEVGDLLYLLRKANEAESIAWAARHLDKAMYFAIDLLEDYENGQRKRV